jgi:2,5-diketo-D-gluconate reductase B
MGTTIEIQETSVPAIGLGTWQIMGDDCIEAVRDALALGYRHVDTARAYDNEREVGEGLRASGVARDDVFLTTKVWMDDAAPDRVRASCEGSLTDLGVDRVDLLLLHWPNDDVPIADTLEAMSVLCNEGLIGHFGVSNFPPALLREALEVMPIFCDQVEFHPFLAQDELLEVAEADDVLVVAYSPLAHGRVPDDPTLREIGAAHGKSPGQVALRWLLDHPRTCALPKASSHERRAENLDVFDFALSDEERARIDALPKDQRESSPAWAPTWDG